MGLVLASARRKARWLTNWQAAGHPLPPHEPRNDGSLSGTALAALSQARCARFRLATHRIARDRTRRDRSGASLPRRPGFRLRVRSVVLLRVGARVAGVALISPLAAARCRCARLQDPTAELGRIEPNAIGSPFHTM